MTIGNCIFSLVLMPLQLLFEVVFDYAYSFLGHPGLAIIALSIAINILVLPLYQRADAMQEKQRSIEAKLHDGVTHIRKTFRGDEKTMMLQTYYRQNNYSPVLALRGVTSLLLEIPFFIAAYRFLSGLELLNGVSLGPIKDLSKPDELLKVCGIAVNILPVLMTGINIISCVVFTKGAPAKTKLQLYAMAAFFLVFLYTCPSGLVFYWTLNNAFSLIKTLFYKMKNPKKVISIALLVCGISLFGYTLFHFSSLSLKAKFFLSLFSFVLCIPQVYSIIGQKSLHLDRIFDSAADKRLFFSGAIFLAVLTGLLIPSTYINASPQEFVDAHYYVHPLWYVLNSFLVSSGVFVIWLGVYYSLASSKAKTVFEWMIWVCSGVAIANYLFFGTNLGDVSSILQYGIVSYSSEQIRFNFAVVSVLTLLLLAFVVRKGRIAGRITAIAAATMCCMSVINIFGISRSIAKVDIQDGPTTEEISLSLSRDQENVVVIMLDRAMGAYIPYIINEKPELKEKFDGFTYFSNVISFGAHTNFTTPALFGGYEYTPVELNLRENELLVDKHNEALKVLPVIFDNAGFDVTVCDPPYAGYQWTSDLSIYDNYADINRYCAIGSFSTGEIQSHIVENRFRNFFCFSIFKISPLIFQKSLYNQGRYHQPSTDYVGGQAVISNSTAFGFNSLFYNSFSVLENLPYLTHVNDKEGSFIMLQNDTTHNAVLFQEPDYLFSDNVDNTEYDENNMGRFSVNGRTIKVESSSDFGAYETNVAALIKIGEWLEYLRDEEVYDNTRIIIVSDHGWGQNQLEELIIDETGYESDLQNRYGDAQFFFPLLMVKDFYSKGFSVSDEFMTNADVPTLAVKGVIDNPINPFTGKKIESSEKMKHDQYIIASHDYDILTNNGTQFHSARWYSVKEDIWNRASWNLAAEDAILPVVKK